MFLNKVEICGVNTSELPLLSDEEKENLFIQIEQGNMDAREQYVKGNLRLVLSVIQRFSSNHEHADDLFQVGCIGLMKAIDNFDRTLNVKFSTYAVPMILGEVRTPTIEEVSKKTEIPEEDIIYALDAIATPMSLFEPVYQDGNDPLFLMDQICDKKNKEDTWIEHLSLQEAMNQLSGREYHIIEKRFFEGKTQTEVADEISISQAQVSRLEKNALKSIRNFIER